MLLPTAPEGGMLCVNVVGRLYTCTGMPAVPLHGGWCMYSVAFFLPALKASCALGCHSVAGAAATDR